MVMSNVDRSTNSSTHGLKNDYRLSNEEVTCDLGNNTFNGVMWVNWELVQEKSRALTGVAQLVGCHPVKWKVPGSIPGQGICLGCWFGPWLG